MIIWRVYDKDLKQNIDLAIRMDRKKYAIKEMERIQNARKKMGKKPANLEVRKYNYPCR